ncbi:MAG: hypothetical protein ACI4TX_03455 [Christensenellales bacterium]
MFNRFFSDSLLRNENNKIVGYLNKNVAYNKKGDVIGKIVAEDKRILIKQNAHEIAQIKNDELWISGNVKQVWKIIPNKFWHYFGFMLIVLFAILFVLFIYNVAVLTRPLAFSISSEKKQWSSLNELSVFSSEFYGDKSIIFPGMTSTYDFTIENKNFYAVNFNITLSEENPYNLPLKYRVRLVEDEFLADSLKSISQLDFYQFEIKPYQVLKMCIDWTWVESDDDNRWAGIDVSYSLNLKVEFI